MDKTRSSVLKRASWVGIIGNAILAAFKIVIGFISGSFAVIGDGVDSLSDVLTYAITLVTARIISKPPDPKYPYGYKKAETISTKILSFIIFFAGAQLLIATTSRILAGESREIPSMLAIIVTLFSIIGKWGLATWQFKVGKKTKSTMIIANAKNMRNDIVISISVLIGLTLTFYFKSDLFDLATGFLVSMYIIWVALKIFIETSSELMDGVGNTEVYFKIFKAVEQVEGVKNPHRIRVRRLADMLLIAMDIEVNPTMSVLESHKVSMEVEQQLHKNIPNIYDILIHIEPYGNIETGEAFGISKENIKT